jgi:iron complex transport system substrate-binding protein
VLDGGVALGPGAEERGARLNRGGIRVADHGRVAVTGPRGSLLAATEILIGIGCADRLVALSNFDPNRDETANLPRVGDYQTTDWERLAALRPRVMVTQVAADRLPRGMVDKAAALNIQLVNVPITRLADIEAAMRTLGRAVDESQLGMTAADQLQQRIAALRERTKSGRRVRTLIVVDDDGRSVAGRENYLNDALEAAGGENVIRGPQPYPTIDREVLLDLDPEVIFQLLPDASPQVRAAAQQLWRSTPTLRAVRDGRVHIFTDPWALRPSHHVADLAERVATALNEVRPATTRATTRVTLSPSPGTPGEGWGEGLRRRSE